MKEVYELNKQEKEKLKHYIKDKAFRKQYFENRLYSFWLYYFWHFFDYPSSNKHKEIAKDLIKNQNIMFIAFREFWKSIWILVKIIHEIVYNKSNFILYFSYEQRLSAGRLFDIIVQLKTNNKLINDFGNIFPDNSTKEEDGLQKKTVSEFITSNNIKVKAMSIWTTARWLLYSNKEWAYRPDSLYLDDVDILDSVRNPEIINKNYEFLQNEVIGWVDSDCKITFLWNIIWADGLVPRFEKTAKESNNWILHKVPVKIGNEFVWDRFVETEEEVQQWKEKGIKKISLEKKREEQGDSFNANFMLIPSMKIWDPVFNQDIILEAPKLNYKQDKRYKDLRIYQQPQDNLYIWVDTALWNKDWDYSAIVWINNNKELIFTYRSKIQPDLLADVLVYIFKEGYKGLIVPENNSIWLSTIDKLKQTNIKNNIYTEKTIDKITQRPSKKFWFNTNAKTKHLLITWLEESIRKKEMIEFDERTKEDLLNYYYDEKGSTNALKWYYDDLVIATALALFGTKQPKKIIFA